VPDLLSVGLVELRASDLPHFSCAQRLLAERMITIVAYFRVQVVNFIFGGRNTGQNRNEGDPTSNSDARQATRFCLVVLLRWSTRALINASLGIMRHDVFGDCKDASLSVELDSVGRIRGKLDFAGFCPQPGDYVPNRTSPLELRHQ